MKLSSDFTSLERLPTKAVTRDGAEIILVGEIWRVSGPSHVNRFSFRLLRQFCLHDMVETAKRIVLHYIQSYSLSYAEICLKCLIRFARFAGGRDPISAITAQDVLAYRSSLTSDDEHYLGTLKAFFRTWKNLRLPCLDPEVVSAMSRMRLKGTKKGEPVRTADPVKGPFTDLELQAIITNLNDAFARDQVGVEDFVLIQLLLAIGARPIQLAGLKLGDFSATRADDGTTVYLLRVPRAKQPNQKLRTEFKIRKLSEDLGTLIEAHCQLARTRWADLCTKVDDIPFFVNRTKSNTIDGLQYHSSSDELAIRVQAVFDILSIPSERTGEPINVTSYRFRRTLGTRAAQEGMSELIIAELLDHTDTQNVGVYVEAVPEIVERIDKAMAMHLAPMAQAFAGVLIDGEDEAERAGDVRSRIVSPTALKNPLGNCGSYGFCGAMAPVACYTCRNFQPWVDGPHEEVLDRLIAERERVVAETGDVTIASVNDRVIYACAQVVKLCQRRMAGDAR